MEVFTDSKILRGTMQRLGVSNTLLADAYTIFTPLRNASDLLNIFTNVVTRELVKAHMDVMHSSMVVRRDSGQIIEEMRLLDHNKRYRI